MKNKSNHVEDRFFSCVAVAGPWPWPDGRMASPLVVAGWPGRGRMAGWPGWPAR